jgi:hypothetical protein
MLFQQIRKLIVNDGGMGGVDYAINANTYGQILDARNAYFFLHVFIIICHGTK